MTRVIPVVSFIAFLASVGCKVDTTSCEARDLPEIQYFEDLDEDGFGNPDVFVVTCDPPEDFVVDSTDCDDLRPSVFPFAPELCDGLDNNCNFTSDEGLPSQDFWLDNDGDGFGDPALQIEECSVPPGAADRPGDCNDADPAINPDAVEVCDTIDNDCDGLSDDADGLPVEEGGLDLTTAPLWYPDLDGDTFGNWDEETALPACLAPDMYVADASDCEDDNPMVNPTNNEVCNGSDDDCDQLYDDSDPDLDISTQTEWFIDTDADGYGEPSESFFTCTTPWFYATNADDCDDTNPLVLSEVDTFWVVDVDGDGFGAGEPSPNAGCTPPAATGWASAVAGEDCDESDVDINPGAREVCDTFDNDCDTLIDDDDLPDENGMGGVDVATMTPWFVDADSDTWGDETQGMFACSQPEGLVADGGDCNDMVPVINPDALEVCNGGVDDDCNGLGDDQDPGLDLDAAEVFVRDFDQDGWGDINSLIRACTQPDGYVTTFGDCDDTDPSLQLASGWWQDTDGDGQGAGDVTIPASCFAPDVGFVPHFAGAEADCAPDDPLAFSGPEVCYDGIDQNCDGTDFDPTTLCELDLPDTCEDALIFNPLVPAGQEIRGDMADATNDLDPTPAGCTGQQAMGREEILPLSIPAGATLTASLTVSNGDGSIYVLPGCFSAQVCYEGVDNSGQNGSTEQLTWTNTSTDTEIVYLVLDAFEDSDSRPFVTVIDLQ